eukprot:scaffold68363_cov39-Prasinocladus_malaysianus.AAC.2
MGCSHLAVGRRNNKSVSISFVRALHMVSDQSKKYHLRPQNPPSALPAQVIQHSTGVHTPYTHLKGLRERPQVLYSATLGDIQSAAQSVGRLPRADLSQTDSDFSGSVLVVQRQPAGQRGPSGSRPP